MEIESIYIGIASLSAYDTFNNYFSSFHENECIIFGIFVKKGKETFAAVNQLYPPSYGRPADRFQPFKTSFLQKLFPNKLIKKYEKKELESLGYIFTGEENALLSTFNKFSDEQRSLFKDLCEKEVQKEINKFEEEKPTFELMVTDFRDEFWKCAFRLKIPKELLSSLEKKFPFLLYSLTRETDSVIEKVDGTFWFRIFPKNSKFLFCSVQIAEDCVFFRSSNLSKDYFYIELKKKVPKFWKSPTELYPAITEEIQTKFEIEFWEKKKEFTILPENYSTLHPFLKQKTLLAKVFSFLKEEEAISNISLVCKLWLISLDFSFKLQTLEKFKSNNLKGIFKIEEKEKEKLERFEKKTIKWRTLFSLFPKKLRNIEKEKKSKLEEKSIEKKEKKPRKLKVNVPDLDKYLIECSYVQHFLSNHGDEKLEQRDWMENFSQIFPFTEFLSTSVYRFQYTNYRCIFFVIDEQILQFQFFEPEKSENRFEKTLLLPETDDKEDKEEKNDDYNSDSDDIISSKANKVVSGSKVIQFKDIFAFQISPYSQNKEILFQSERYEENEIGLKELISLYSVNLAPFFHKTLLFYIRNKLLDGFILEQILKILVMLFESSGCGSTSVISFADISSVSVEEFEKEIVVKFIYKFEVSHDGFMGGYTKETNEGKLIVNSFDWTFEKKLIFLDERTGMALS